ncbi:hypothetical protein RB195_024085 [Necator americanus]|uniref:Reverse transcriptase domain-containing protein n=1 Tax=Necator americanus TaxID=51031 RepID=A0ABR1EP50_NECAM
MEKNICYRQPRRKEVVYDDCILEDSLSQGDWHIEEDPNVDYEMLLRGLRACAERASKPRTTNLDQISKITKELLERRRTLRFNPKASHIERQKKILEAAQRRASLNKCRRDLREYNIPLEVLLSEDGTSTSSHVQLGSVLQLLGPHPDRVEGHRAAFPPPSHHTHTHWKGVRQGDNKSPKLFAAALQWIMKSLSWEERGTRVDGRFLSNLRFADDIVLLSSSTNEAETMLNELNEARKRVGLRINRKKTQFMKNAYCEDGGVQLEDSKIVETSSYVYLGRPMNMENDLKEKLNRRIRTARAAFAAVREATDQLTDQDLLLFQRSVTQRRRRQTLLPRPGSYLLPTEPLRDAF